VIHAERGASITGMTGLAENPQGSLAINSNGQPNGARNMTLDGTDNNENVLGGNIVIPSQESVQRHPVWPGNSICLKQREMIPGVVDNETTRCQSSWTHSASY